ncbi:L-rhamnose-binding lectin CSL2-like [Myxocyprinus asiaticus]|uniref:L-rhamnose-binding lectin CSL2-like n=1 Tax=Myxocyprinus asiaticus TaxID=70543 RepID=UPI002221C5A1|nr:L-rhamnose-binding lectin CSL2-like [Myxocyprinus asiaticus]
MSAAVRSTDCAALPSRLLSAHLYLSVSFTEQTCCHPPKTKEIICEGEYSFLNCDTGFIKVLEANYGRKTQIFAASKKHPSYVFYCLAMYHRCIGRDSCSVPAVNAVFSDPCSGISKYLYFSYQCLPFSKSHMHITVPLLRPKACIPDTTATILYLKSHHKYTQTLNLQLEKNEIKIFLILRCNGKESCQRSASNSEFSDPCIGVNKYLEVTYSCI